MESNQKNPSPEERIIDTNQVPKKFSKNIMTQIFLRKDKKRENIFFFGLILIVIAVSLTTIISINRRREVNNIKPTSKVEKIVETSTVPIPTYTSDYQKTYRNEEFGFELKYPAEFSSQEVFENLNTIFKIGDSPKFEGEENALVISISYQLKDGFADGSASLSSEEVEKVGFSSLKEKFGERINWDFQENFPWEYYKFFISSKETEELNTGFEISIRIHNSDKTESGGGEYDLETARKILDSFRFFDRETNSIREVIYKNAKYGYQFSYLKTNNILQYSCDENQYLNGDENLILKYPLTFIDQAASCTFFEWYKPIEVFVKKGDYATRTVIDKEFDKSNWEAFIKGTKIDKRTASIIALVYTGPEEEFPHPNYSEVRILNSGYTYFIVLGNSEDKMFNRIFINIISTFRFTN